MLIETESNISRNEHNDILQYMAKYPSFNFNSRRLGKHFKMSSQRMSKLLLMFYLKGWVVRIDRNSKRSQPKYRIK